ncbi:MAG: YiiX/YebB-like N1pC/P60 family cysteine hydrolase [Acinetobacter sp.]
MLNKKMTNDEKARNYILRFDELMQPGDVILTAASTISSKGIRKVTRSNFSHAILYLGNSYMHSDLDGVHSDNPQRLLFANPQDVKVLRLKQEHLNAQTIENICAFARSEHGKQYSKFEAAKSVLTPNALNQKNRQFCSRLVAQSFENANIKIVKNSNYCTPHEISISDYFEEILDVTKLANDEEIEFANSKSLLPPQTYITNNLLKNIRALTGQDIQTLNEIDSFLVENPEYDNQITELLKNSGYLEIWKMDCEKNPWRYDGKVFLNFENPNELNKFKKAYKLEAATYKDLIISMAIGELDCFSGKTISINEVLRFQYQYNLYSILFNEHKLNYFQTQISLYKQLLWNCKKRMNAAEHVLKHYGVIE